MNILFPIIAAVLQAGSSTLDKVVLSVRRIDYKTYTGVSFPLIFVFTLVIFLIFRPPLHIGLFAGSVGLLILLSIVLSTINNLLFYRALDEDTLGEMQIIRLVRNIPIILFAGIIFTDERNLFVILPAMIASVVVIWSHWEHHHFELAKKTKLFVIWSLIYAPIGAAIIKSILVLWNPISLELIRSGAIALFLVPLFFGSIIKNISPKAFLLLIGTNILTAIAWILFYFSYQHSGIIYTTLVFSLQPLLVYLASLILLKEKLQPKKALAFVVVLVSIAVAQFIG